jgi:phospholipase D1/2
LHPNIKVFRHPDHTPRGNEILTGLAASFQNLSLRSSDILKASKESLQALYGGSDDMVLFWAHHEKLCLIDGKIAFMGGLDMCRSGVDDGTRRLLLTILEALEDTIRTVCLHVYRVANPQTDKAGHPIADAHPGNIDDIVFPGQDYNNARVYDFEDVQKWENNKREFRRYA